MGRKSRRAVYDPSIMDRVDDIQPLDPDPLSFADADLTMPEDSYETQETEILDPKLHRTASASKKSRTRFLVLTGLVTAGLIAIIVTSAVIISKNKSGSSSSDGGGSESTASSATLATMPSNLEETCVYGFNNRNSGDVTALEACRTSCAAAECCNIPSNFDSSCLKGNEEECLQYHQACYVLTLGNNVQTVPTSQTKVDPAPANLADLCNFNNLTNSEGIRACASACIPYECCYETGVTNCQASNPTTCPTYAPCLNLRAINDVHQDVTGEIARACTVETTVTTRGRLECRNACKLGECCFVGNKQCGPDRPAEFCQVQYRPCQILYDGTLSNPPVDDGFDDSVMEDDGAAGDDDDFLDDDVNDAEEEDGELDDDDYIDDTVAFDGDVQYDDPNSVNGRPYLDEPPAGMKYTCNANSWNQDPTKKSLCRSYCKEAVCCQFDPSLPQSCLGEQPVRCMKYQEYCGALFGNQEVSNEEVHKAPKNITEVCSPVSLSTQAGMDACSGICEPAKCCYDWEAAHCRGNTMCPGYAPCLNLHTMAQDHPSVENTVDDICNTEMLQNYETRLHCQSICMQHACCWTADQPFCADNVGESCDLYQRCKDLHLDGEFNKPWNNAATNGLPNPDDLASVCQSEATLDDCEEMCAKAECCNLPENFEGSCLRGKHLQCLKIHRQCAVVDLGTKQNTTVTIDPAPQDIVAYCSVESLATDYGRAKCQDICDPVVCCWGGEDDLGENLLSCRDRPNCEGYYQCLALRSSSTIDETITDEVEGACTKATLENPGGLEVCQQVCLQHRCCWDIYDDDIDECFGNSTCVQYSACDVLNTDDDDADDPVTRRTDRNRFLR